VAFSWRWSTTPLGVILPCFIGVIIAKQKGFQRSFLSISFMARRLPALNLVR
jgi:hypothetical protein